MTTALLPATIAALASVVIAIVSVLVTARTTRRVARLTTEMERQKVSLAAELAEHKAVRDARRDYEYEARKRLYAQCEPLIFQAAEQAEMGRRRIMSLARTCRHQDLMPDGRGWLSDRGYYFQSTAYFLLAPMTSAKILQRRLTSIDLSLEPRIRVGYEILKLLFVSFTDDHALAKLPPVLPYSPDEADPGKPHRGRLLRRAPQTYQRQGFYLGTLETIVEALIVPESTGSGGTLPRCMSFGEFEAAWDNRTGEFRNIVIPRLSELLTGFHPLARPALWRVLASQYLLYGAFAAAQRREWTHDGQLGALLRRPTSVQVADLDWRSDPGAATDDDIRTPLLVAYTRLRRTISDLDRSPSIG
jgi:hypothetical protein